MSSLDRLIDNKTIQNLFVWLFFFLILISTVRQENKVATAFFAIGLLAPAVYISNLLILPYLKKKTAVFIGLFLVNALVFTAISVLLTIMITDTSFEWKQFANFLGIMLLALILAATLKIARDSFSRRQQEKNAELQLLKAQLNPHFLFNTLNNLYGLAVTKSDKLPGLMLKLSDLLRYSLYETKEITVPLEMEIQYLENYIALEKIRLEDRTVIIFENNVTDPTIKIAPMLLIVFVENAFKHLSTPEDLKSRVFVSIKEKDRQLHFKCINTFSSNNMQHDHSLEKGRSGIGLHNVKKRLALLYPEKHSLDINSDNNEYQVNLTLDVLQ